MIRHLLVVGIGLCSAGIAVAQEEIPAGQAERVDFLIAAMGNQDENIRREALRRLRQEEELPATASLVAHLVGGNLDVATRSAHALVERLDFLRRNPNPEGPRLILLDPDRRQLEPVRAILDDDRVAHWRWYLAAHVIMQVDPGRLADHLPAFVRALEQSKPLRQYAAIKAVFRIGKPAASAKNQLLNVLRATGRPPFEGIYMRYNRIIESNAVAFSADVRVYDAKIDDHRYYAHDDLLIIDTLLALGASFAEVGPQLASLSRHENESIQLQAAGMLAKLGPQGKSQAAAAIARLLKDRDSFLVRDLSEEDDRTRQEAVDLIAQLGEQAGPAVSATADLLNSRQAQLRNSGALALGKLGRAAKEAEDALRRAIAMELLVGDAQAQVSPLAKQRAEARLADMKEALKKVTAAPANDS